MLLGHSIGWKEDQAWELKILDALGLCGFKSSMSFGLGVGENLDEAVNAVVTESILSSFTRSRETNIHHPPLSHWFG